MFRFLARLLGVVIGVSVVVGGASALAAVNYRKKAPPRPRAADDEIDVVAVMEGAEFASTSSSFRGGRVVCWYAGLDVDLRDAAIDPAGAELEVRTVFGGTRVVVAPGTPVSISAPAIFGGVMNSSGGPEPTASAPGLRITGFSLFGGLQVIASERGEEIPAWAGEREHEHEHVLDGQAHEGSAPVLDAAPDLAPA